MNNNETRTIEIEYTQTLPELEDRAKELMDEYAEEDYCEYIEDAPWEIADTVTPIHYNELIGVWYHWGGEFEGFTKDVLGEYHGVDSIHKIIESDLHYYLEHIARQHGYNQGYFDD